MNFRLVFFRRSVAYRRTAAKDFDCPLIVQSFAARRLAGPSPLVDRLALGLVGGNDHPRGLFGTVGEEHEDEVAPRARALAEHARVQAADEDRPVVAAVAADR